MLDLLKNGTLKEIEAKAKTLDWCQLSEIIMELEISIEIADFSSVKQYEKAIDSMDVLDAVKWDMVQNAYNHERHQTEQQLKTLVDDEYES